MDVKSPGNILLDILSPGNDHRLWVITGSSGAGKTSWCQKIVSEAQDSGLRVSGLLSPGRYENGFRNGIYTLCLGDDQPHLLASLFPDEIEGIQFGPWTFDPGVFSWGNRYLLDMTAFETDIMVIDELGFLEFNLQKGWMAAFEILSQGKFRAGIVVIRPECILSFVNLGFQFNTWKVANPPPP